ncbi:hypothetical protein TSAR_006153, partial [Trichomalopsis sarcophagae]
MRLPHTIPSHAFEAFRCSEETQLLPAELGRTLRAEDETWDEVVYTTTDGRQQRRGQQPEDLKSLALRAIARDWRNRPLFDELPTDVDRDHLLEILPLDIPFELAIKAVPYEYYWKRAAEARWRFNDPSSHGDSWLRLYCERHLSEWLERLDPAASIHRYDVDDESATPVEHRQPERLSSHCEALLELLREHVRTLRLRQLVPLRGEPIRTSTPRDDEDEEVHKSPLKEPEVHHLPMDLLLEKLPNVREVHANIGMIFLSDGVEWQDFTFSVEDSRRIGRGLRGLERLSKFSLTRSCLDRPRAAAILQGLAVSPSIEEIDFSHCKLGDAGAHAIGAFLSRRARTGRLKVLRLVNNGIGSSGVAGIVRGLLVPTDDHDDDEDSARGELARTLARLDLRLNPIGDEGAKHLAALLLRYPSLEYLNASGCSLAAEGGMGMAEVLASGTASDNFTSGLELDFSNNEFGTIVGEAFEIVAKSCRAIRELDVRMCGFRKESEYSIADSVARNRASLKKESSRLCPEDRRTTSIGIQSSRGEERVRSLLPPREFEAFQRPQRHVNYYTESYGESLK